MVLKRGGVASGGPWSPTSKKAHATGEALTLVQIGGDVEHFIGTSIAIGSQKKGATNGRHRGSKSFRTLSIYTKLHLLGIIGWHYWGFNRSRKRLLSWGTTAVLEKPTAGNWYGV